MKKNPKKLFVVSMISRADIAKILNEAIDAGAMSDVDKFRKDDSRLTDKVCKEVAAMMHDAESQEDAVEEADLAAGSSFVCSLPESLRKRPKARGRV